MSLLALGGCAADAGDDSDPALAASEVNVAAGMLSFQLAGTTSLACDGGPLCVLSGAIHSVDASGRKTRAFAEYLSGQQPAPFPSTAATCTLTFGVSAAPIGGGYLESPRGCELPQADGAYDGELRYAYALSHDDLSRALAQNVTLHATSWNGKSKFVVSFAIKPSFSVNGGSSWPADADATTVGTSLPANMYTYAFSRASTGELALHVRRASDNAGRWIKRLGSPEAHDDYEVTNEEGVALYDGSKGSDGVGYAALLSPRLFVERAAAGSYWKMSVQQPVPGDHAQMAVEPRIAAAPFALDTKGGREGYSDAPGDTTGLSDCKRAKGDAGWTATLVVRR